MTNPIQEKIQSLRNETIGACGLFLNGKSVPAQDGKTLPVISPIDGTELTTIAAASPADVDQAVTHARKRLSSLAPGHARRPQSARR